MSGFTGYIQLVYVLTAALFVVGLHLMNSRSPRGAVTRSR